ncbi:hypothetical protein JTE90_010236 [Oedothorax gibbosus]|uniref:Estradiol 17-beta-dehydrogenase 2 n=1 Tax=Oedothorax gibbosus TaxID=931172 RepID=A0AAV6TZN0_9ARAC|nr:hypothetical protein JTE90_010236 [Oedothorax gibbosus]
MTKENIFRKRIEPRNKAVFISGCDSGFGNLAARRLDYMGFTVLAGCYFSDQGGAAELVNCCSDRLKLVQIDVADDDSVEKAKHFIEKNLGYNDLWSVVNNAGVYKGLDIEFTQLSDFKEVFDVNTFGQVRVTKALLPLLKKCKGRVINVNSMAGRHPSAHMAAYAMSKHASVAFTECLRQEMEDWGVQVISVEPDFFKTPLTDTTNIRSYLKHFFSMLDEKTKEDYGQQYLEKTSLMMEKTFGVVSSSKIELVTKAIEKAVTARNPCLNYKPCGSMVRRIGFYVAENVDCFLELFLKVYFGLWGIPKPKHAR